MKKLAALASLALLQSTLALAQDAAPAATPTPAVAAPQAATATPAPAVTPAPAATPDATTTAAPAPTEQAAPVSTEAAPPPQDMGSTSMGGEPEAMSSGMYGELGFTKLKGRNPAYLLNSTTQPTMLRGIVGKDFMPYLSGEVMLGVGLSADTINYTYTPANTTQAVQANALSEIKSMIGVYVVPKFKINDRAQVYARLGFTNMTVSETSAAIHAALPAGISNNLTNGKKNSFSWGVGGGYRFGDNVGLNADYTVYHKKGDVKIDGLTLGLGYQF